MAKIPASMAQMLNELVLENLSIKKWQCYLTGNMTKRGKLWVNMTENQYQSWVLVSLQL